MNERKFSQDWPKIRSPIPEPPELTYPDEDLDWEALWCRPVIHETAWVSPGTAVVGRVRLKARRWRLLLKMLKLIRREWIFP